MASEQLIVLPIQAVYPGRAREASVYIEALGSTPGCLVHANLFAHEDGTGTVGVLLPDLFAEHRVKGGALSVKVCVPEDHKQDSSDDLWRLVEGASTTPVKGMDGVLNSVVLPGSFTPVVDVSVGNASVCPSGRLEPVVVAELVAAAEPVAEPVAVAKKARRGRSTNVAPDLTLSPPPRGGRADAFGFTG
jgi:hypothetical protein